MDTLVNLQVAKLAHKHGFGGEKYTTNFSYHGDILVPIPENNHSMFRSGYAAPTQTTLQMWLMEQRDILVWVVPLDKNKFQVYYKRISDKGQMILDIFPTFDRAMDVGLEGGLKLLDKLDYAKPKTK